jgi:hypothetical protein
LKDQLRDAKDDAKEDATDAKDDAKDAKDYAKRQPRRMQKISYFNLFIISSFWCIHFDSSHFFASNYQVPRWIISALGSPASPALESQALSHALIPHPESTLMQTLIQTLRALLAIVSL